MPGGEERDPGIYCRGQINKDLWFDLDKWKTDLPERPLWWSQNPRLFIGDTGNEAEVVFLLKIKNLQYLGFILTGV